MKPVETPRVSLRGVSRWILDSLAVPSVELPLVRGKLLSASQRSPCTVRLACGGLALSNRLRKNHYVETAASCLRISNISTKYMFKI